MTRHAPTLGCITLTASIPAQPDPSKIIGTIGPRPAEPELPPIPSPGFYWARISGAERWEPVEVYEAGVLRVDSIGIEENCTVTEWGPKLTLPA